MTSWTQRMVDRISAHPALVLTMFLSSVVAACLVLAGFGILVYRWADETYFWQTDEYKKLTALRAGFALSRFDEQLGAPLFRRPVSDMAPRAFADTPRAAGLMPATRVPLKTTGLIESSFRGPGYWVQTINDERNGAGLRRDLLRR